MYCAFIDEHGIEVHRSKALFVSHEELRCTVPPLRDSKGHKFKYASTLLTEGQVEMSVRVMIGDTDYNFWDRRFLYITCPTYGWILWTSMGLTGILSVLIPMYMWWLQPVCVMGV
jgi:hypothetical protein